VIAEDLGVITPDVDALRNAFGLPGMKVLQFAFSGDASHAYLPHNYPPNCCVYTGTHDNDTTVGWWRGAATERERRYAAAYLQCDDSNVDWQMMRAAWASVAGFAACQLQDVLGLDSEHRLNTPGRLDCWTWRFRWDQVGSEPARKLAQLATTYGRAPFDLARLGGDRADAERTRCEGSMPPLRDV
jgi:4-alpha-glucanotransferase